MGLQYEYIWELYIEIEGRAECNEHIYSQNRLLLMLTAHLSEG